MNDRDRTCRSTRRSPFDVATPVAAERTWDLLLAIAAGGAIGGAARYSLSQATPGYLFPWSTFLENVVGCFLLGALMIYLLTSGHLTDICVPSWPSVCWAVFPPLCVHSEARALVQDGQVPIVDLLVHQCRRGTGGRLVGNPAGTGTDQTGAHMKLRGPAMRLTIFVGRAISGITARCMPLVVHRAHAAGLAGASVMRGIEGFGASSRCIRRVC